MMRVILPAVLALALAGPAAAQTSPPAQPTPEQMAAAPSDFVSNAASMGMAEVALGRMAMEKAQSEQIKEFARHVAEDHARNNQKLQQAAQQAGVRLPAQPQPDEQATIQRLQSLSGQEFDRAFADQMVKDHQQAIALNQSQARGGEVPAIRDYAQQTLPALQQHLQQAQQVASAATGR